MLKTLNKTLLNAPLPFLQQNKKCNGQIQNDLMSACIKINSFVTKDTDKTHHLTISYF